MLKPLLAAALLTVASAADAGSYSFSNNVGGKTVITDHQTFCKSMNAYDGFAWNEDKSKYSRFCWVPSGAGNSVDVIFPDGHSARWPMEIFTKDEVEPDVSFIITDQQI